MYVSIIDIYLSVVMYIYIYISIPIYMYIYIAIDMTVRVHMCGHICIDALTHVQTKNMRIYTRFFRRARRT